MLLALISSIVRKLPIPHKIAKCSKLPEYGSKSVFPWMAVELTFTESQGCCNSTLGKFDSIAFHSSAIPTIYICSSSQFYWVEVNFRTTKKIAQSNHEIVPLDGRIAPEGCFDPWETFKSSRWPSPLWMIAKRCKLSCSKSTSGERESVWPFLSEIWSSLLGTRP